MGDLSKLSDREKVWFLQQALIDAGLALMRKGEIEAATRYIGYVREMQGAVKGKEPAP